MPTCPGSKLSGGVTGSHCYGTRFKSHFKLAHNILQPQFQYATHYWLTNGYTETSTIGSVAELIYLLFA